MKSWGKALWISFMVLNLVLGSMSVAAEEDTTAAGDGLAVSTSAEIVTELGVLVGEGNGVTDEYLAKTTTRLQGAILTLRLLGKEKEAQAFKGTDNFSDASSVGAAMRPVLAYLKSHPEMGWNGTGGGKFSPNASITAQQVYKVLLESLSFKTGTDFPYADTITFAASKGLMRAASASPFTNRDLAAALTEALQATPKGGSESLLKGLVKAKAVAEGKAALLDAGRIDLRTAADGSVYFTDGKGMALYLFTKDMADLNSCTGQCLANWPVFSADRLLLADGLDKKDFGAFVRADGKKQLTYKGWPLYYFVNDKNPGEVNGEGRGGVWFLIKKPFYTVGLGTHATLNINYLVDANGKSLYYFDKDPKNASVCSGSCLVNWPAFYEKDIVVPGTLKASDFGEIKRADGSMQTTYKGYPLYYWIKDAKRGDTTGHDVNKVWFLVDPANFTGTTAQTNLTGSVTIEMKDYAFSTPDITIKAGSTVTFMNRDTAKHNAVSADGKTFKTALLSQGESVTIKLDTPGTYEYYCEPHQDHMKGKIIVQ